MICAPTGTRTPIPGLEGRCSIQLSYGGLLVYYSKEKMKILVQRTTKARVRIEKRTVGKIEKGLVVFVGFCKEDNHEKINKAVKKLVNLRVFPDEHDKTNLSIKEVGGKILVVSQFTLCADTKKGNRPSFVKTLEPQKARELYDRFIELLKKEGVGVETGTFGAQMQVELVNWGPFTLWLEI